MPYPTHTPAPQRIRLEIQGDVLRFVVLPSSSETSRSVPAGSIAHVQHLLRHEPVGAAALEAAIEVVEDLVMPVLRMLPAGAQLELAGPAWHEVAGALPASGQPVSIEAVEALFNRLADVASGSPVGRLGVPATASLAVSLLLLREVMHHGGFGGVWLAPATT